MAWIFLLWYESIQSAFHTLHILSFLSASSQCTHRAGVPEFWLCCHCFPCCWCFPTASPTDRAFYQLPAAIFWHWFVAFHRITEDTSVPYFMRCNFNASFIFSPPRYRMYKINSTHTYPDDCGRHCGTFSCIRNLHSNIYPDADRSKRFYILFPVSFPPPHFPSICFSSISTCCSLRSANSSRYPTKDCPTRKPAECQVIRQP